MLPAPATRAVICSAAPLPYPADAGTPRHTGPRRLIACLAAAGATQPDLRRPGALKITASCVQRPLRACHAHCLRPAALTLRPRRPRSARASRSGILHASPSLRWSSQLRARGKQRSLRCASFRARLRHASASFAREKTRRRSQVFFPPRRAAPCISPVYRPHPPAQVSRGPDAVPSEDYSRWPPCCAGYSGEGR